MKSIASEKNYSINDECCSSQSLTSAFVHKGQNWLQGKKVGTKNHLPNVVYSNQERKNRNYKKRSRVEKKVGTNNAKTNLSALIRRKDYDEKKKKKTSASADEENSNLSSNTLKSNSWVKTIVMLVITTRKKVCRRQSFPSKFHVLFISYTLFRRKLNKV